MSTFDNYEAFLQGIINQLTHEDGKTDPADTSPADPAHLLPHHLDLLISLQQALAARAEHPVDALRAWDLIHSTLWNEVAAAKSVVEDTAVDEVERRITTAGHNFTGAAYHAAEHAAQGHLEVPDVEEQKAHLENAEKELLEADKLWEGASKVMASGVDKTLRIEGVSEIIELVRLPGTIQEKMVQARAKGLQVGTVIELVGKVKGATATLLKVTAVTGERYCEALARQAAAKGNKALLEEIEASARQWKWLGETAQTLGTVASVITVIGEGISMLEYVREGKWDEAAAQAANTAVDAAPLLLGAEVAAPLAGVVLLAKAEMQAIHDAAAFIRYCKDEQVREALGEYVKALTERVYPWAARLTANVEVMLDASLPREVQAAAMDRVNDDAKNTWQNVEFVVGAYLGPLHERAPDVYASMGTEAFGVFSSGLSMPVETKDGMIALTVVDNVAKIMHGANLMAKYVHEHYKN